MYYSNKLCSLCLAQNKKLTPRSGVDSSAEDMIQRIIPEFIQQTSGIERNICDDCLDSVSAVFELRRKYLENIIIFDEYVRKLQENESNKCPGVTIADNQLDLNKEINKEILDEGKYPLEDDLRSNFFEINIKQENPYNKEFNEEQGENVKIKDVVLNIKKEIIEENILDEDKCFPDEEVHTNFVEINIKQENSYNREYNEEKEENNEESDGALSAYAGSDTEDSDESENKDREYKKRLKCTNCGEESFNRMGDTNSLQCQKCQTIFPNTQNKPRKAHSSAEKRYSCNICGNKFTRLDSVKIHKQRVHSNKRPFICNICQKAFADAHHLRRHSLSHTDKKTFECDICQKLFKNTDYLTRHKKIHNEAKRFQCEICQKKFLRKSYLTSHQLTHSGDKRFQCHLCDKNFSRSDTLKLHVKSHSIENPHECNVCKKKFTSSRYFQMHKLLHTKERPLKCDSCDKTFVSNAGLTFHQRSHNNVKSYLCPICQKSFCKKRDLKRHKLSHSGKKLFVCDVCPKKFIWAGSLRDHKRIHDGVKPFKCGFCEKSFHTSGNRNNHEKTHQKENADTAQESVIASNT